MARAEEVSFLNGALDAGLVGLECWYVAAGGSAGTTFSLAFGGKVPRRVPLRNDAHSEEYRLNEGEASLLVWCSWRLDSDAGPLVSSDSPKESVVDALSTLVGRRVESARVLDQGLDLEVVIGGLVLRVFADHVGSEASFDDNWVFRRGAKYAATTSSGDVVFEEASS